MKRRLNVFNIIRRAGACNAVASRYKGLSPKKAYARVSRSNTIYLRWFVRNVVDRNAPYLTIASHLQGLGENDRKYRARLRGYIKDWAKARGVRV